MFHLPANNLPWNISSPQVMGILNITPDSFYEASRHSNIETALAQAEAFIEQGATIIDIGAQSTRPQATLQEAKTELERLLPIVEAILKKFPHQLISIDTFYSSVAEATLKMGVPIINDISAGSFDENMLAVVAKYNAGYIGMHITGNVHSMHQVELRENIMNSMLEYFESKKKLLLSYGIKDWVIDPGFGFGKTVEENFTIIKNLKELKALGLPILIGVSRKSSLYKTLGIESKDALNATTVANTVAILNGADIIRVHDVKEASQIIQLLKYLQ